MKNCIADAEHPHCTTAVQISSFTNFNTNKILTKADEITIKVIGLTLCPRRHQLKADIHIVFNAHTSTCKALCISSNEYKQSLSCVFVRTWFQQLYADLVFCWIIHSVFDMSVQCKQIMRTLILLTECQVHTAL